MNKPSRPWHIVSAGERENDGSCDPGNTNVGGSGSGPGGDMDSDSKLGEVKSVNVANSGPGLGSNPLISVFDASSRILLGLSASEGIDQRLKKLSFVCTTGDDDALQPTLSGSISVIGGDMSVGENNDIKLALASRHATMELSSVFVEASSSEWWSGRLALLVCYRILRIARATRTGINPETFYLWSSPTTFVFRVGSAIVALASLSLV
ncbi:hypothetical protein SUNI508_11136 [Seiridium unicorne]|uniref:Uncharacterized protein n=1 Tax=Seiridium unicorne TaxID=138068 RepID=A0ABR2UIV2_9PEZI